MRLGNILLDPTKVSNQGAYAKAAAEELADRLKTAKDRAGLSGSPEAAQPDESGSTGCQSILPSTSFALAHWAEGRIEKPAAQPAQPAQPVPEP